jgi:hypothetical protein
MISDSQRGNGKSAAKCVAAQRGPITPVVEPGKPPILEVTSTCPVADWVAAHIYDLDALLLGFGAVLIRSRWRTPSRSPGASNTAAVSSPVPSGPPTSR